MAPGILLAAISPSTKLWIGANFAIESFPPGGGPKSAAAAREEATEIAAAIANKPAEGREGAWRVNICSLGQVDSQTLLHCCRPIQIALCVCGQEYGLISFCCSAL